MSALKEITLEIIKRMPDDSSAEDIMYEVNFIAQVMDGLRDSDEGRVISTEELLERIEKW